jgi:opacity protein-like surface antigen
MIKKIAILSFLVFTLSNAADAQEKIFNINWNVGIPMGDTKEFLNNSDISFGGMSLEFRQFVKSNMSIGGYFAWDFYRGSSEEDVVMGNTTLSGSQRMFINSLPFMVNAHYYMGESTGFRPYFGVGLGAVRTLERTEVGTFLIQNNNWQFGYYPELGFMIPVSYSTNINFGVKYNLALESKDAFAHTALVFNIGVSIINF